MSGVLNYVTASLLNFGHMLRTMTRELPLFTTRFPIGPSRNSGPIPKAGLMVPLSPSVLTNLITLGLTGSSVGGIKTSVFAQNTNIAGGEGRILSRVEATRTRVGVTGTAGLSLRTGSELSVLAFTVFVFAYVAGCVIKTSTLIVSTGPMVSMASYVFLPTAVSVNGVTTIGAFIMSGLGNTLCMTSRPVMMTPFLL